MIYLAELDTVRFNPNLDKEILENNFILADAILKIHTLLYRIPILSQTQLMDNRIFFTNNESETNSFCKLIQQDRIKISVYQAENLKAAIINNLKSSFRFSSIIYDDKDKEPFIRKNILNSLINDEPSVDFLSETDISKWYTWIRKLLESVENKKFSTAMVITETLGDRIEKFINKNESLNEKEWIEFLEKAKKDSTESFRRPQDNRSWWYKTLEESYKSDKYIVDSYKQIVDAYYNRVVADSIGAATRMSMSFDNFTSMECINASNLEHDTYKNIAGIIINDGDINEFLLWREIENVFINYREENEIDYNEFIQNIFADHVRFRHNETSTTIGIPYDNVVKNILIQNIENRNINQLFTYVNTIYGE
ncbi:MAG: hypothetical protein ACYCYI_07340 [Saccharofermentanales bacterium]